MVACLALKTVTRISDGEQICEYSHDAYGQQVTQTQYWTLLRQGYEGQAVGRRAYFDTRFELDVDLNHDGDTHELTYIDGGITSTCLDEDPEESPNPDQVQEAKWNSRLDYVSGGSAIHYFDFLIRVPYVANEYYAEPLGYIAYTGTNAIWIFRDKYRVASRHDWTDSLGVDYPLSSGTTAGLHRYGIKVQGGADEFYIDGTLLTGADVACNLTPFALAFFGSRAMVNGSAEDECDHLPGIELFDFISYSKAWNYSTGETTTGCVIQDGPEPGPEQKYFRDENDTNFHNFQRGGSSTVVVETVTTVGGGDPEFTIALVNGRRNAIAYVQDGVEDDIASWDEELGAGYAVETVGITMYNAVDGHGSSTMFATKMTMNGLCAESYTDIEREDTSGSVYFTNARLSLTTVQGLPIQFGESEEEKIKEEQLTTLIISGVNFTQGEGAGTGYALSNDGDCACRGADPTAHLVRACQCDPATGMLMETSTAEQHDSRTGVSAGSDSEESGLFTDIVTFVSSDVPGFIRNDVLVPVLTGATEGLASVARAEADLVSSVPLIGGAWSDLLTMQAGALDEVGATIEGLADLGNAADAFRTSVLTGETSIGEAVDVVSSVASSVPEALDEWRLRIQNDLQTLSTLGLDSLGYDHCDSSEYGAAAFRIALDLMAIKAIQSALQKAAMKSLANGQTLLGGPHPFAGQQPKSVLTNVYDSPHRPNGGRGGDLGEPNSIWRQTRDNGSVTISYYDDLGRRFSREDYGQVKGHGCLGKDANGRTVPHEHAVEFGPHGVTAKKYRQLDENGKPVGDWIYE